MERLDERLNLGAVLIALTDDEDVDVRRGLVLHDESVARRYEIRLHCPVRVDDGDIDVIQCTRQLRRLDLLDLEVLRVVDDVLHRRRRTGTVLQLDEVRTREEQQRTAAVRRVARDGDGCAVLQLVELLDLVRVDAHRLDVDTEDVHELELGMLLNEILQVRLMLEEVRVDLFVVRGDVRLNIVVELDDLELYAFLFEFGADRLEDLRMGNGRCTDLDDLLRLGVVGGLVCAAAAAGEGKCGDGKHKSEQFFHKIPP